MSDLTRLNPTPHAIAVYASQPLSPVATQHSLPSRTLPFTWAGLSPAGSHQLCLAHSFDHLVGAREQRRRHVQAEDRKSVVSGKSGDLGGRRIIQKKRHAYPVLRPARALLARIAPGPRPS